MATSSEEAKLQFFLQWLKVNGAETRGCEIRYCDSTKGFGIFASADVSDGVLLVVPLNLAITPMRVLEDPIIGPESRSAFDEGEVDDRLLVMLFLTVERLRKNSSWKPYLDMLPTTFGNPLWFTDDELSELKGTTLHTATELQKKNLKTLFDEKVKKLVEKILALHGYPESEVRFKDFLWANSIFWTRALSIPLPHSYVFPRGPEEQDNTISNVPAVSTEHSPAEKSANMENGEILQVNNSESQVTSTSQGETVCIEGLVPGIDFCNHDLKAAATWEVDETGSATQVPLSMFLRSAGKITQGEKEISISYGDKGNEELLYLYGFVIKDNPDDYLMIHYPMEAISNVPFAEAKMQLLEEQKGKLRCLVRKNMLNNVFFPQSSSSEGITDKDARSQGVNYSWSGHRKMPSYSNKVVFPEEFLTSLRTIAMKDSEVYQVAALLEELVGSGGARRPSEAEVRAAIWEACGDSGAFQLLGDLLNNKMMELEEGSGTEDHDTELLQIPHGGEIAPNQISCENGSVHSMSQNRWASIVYRQGQKELTRLYIKEAEHALHLALTEEN